MFAALSCKLFMCGKGRSKTILGDRRAGEVAQRGHVLVKSRIRRANRFKVADVERIRHLLVHVVLNRNIARVARVPVLRRKGIEAKILIGEYPVTLLPPISRFDQHVAAEFALNADSPTLHARMLTVVTTKVKS